MKRGSLNHPKTLALAEYFHRPRRDIIGLLEMLFHFTAEYAPRGDVGRYSDKRIAAAVDWQADARHLVDGLLACGWLEADGVHRLVIHDWDDHQDRVTRRRLERQGQTTAKPAKKTSLKNQQDIAKVTANDDSVSPPLLAYSVPTTVPTTNSEPPKAAVSPPVSEYPATAVAIREHFPATDDLFVRRLVTAVVQHVISADLPDAPPDSLIADAVRECSKSAANGQKSAGLFLRTVPQCVKTWMTQGRHRAPPKPPISEKSQRTLEYAAAIEKMARKPS